VSFDANLVGADTDDLQQLLGRSYPGARQAQWTISRQGHAAQVRNIRDYLMWQTRQHGRGALTAHADN